MFKNSTSKIYIYIYTYKRFFFKNFSSFFFWKFNSKNKKYSQKIFFKKILFLEKVFLCKKILFLNSFSSQKIFFWKFRSFKNIYKIFFLNVFFFLQNISFLGFFSLQKILLKKKSISKKYLQKIIFFENFSS